MAGTGDKRRPMAITTKTFLDNYDLLKWGTPEPAGFDVSLPDPLSTIPPEETKEPFLSESIDANGTGDDKERS